MKFPGFPEATGWLNSEPLGPEHLKGKAVLVQFGTFTCINWIRTLPYVRAWADAYREDGLTVVGVNTPEFRFECDVSSVKREIQKRGIRYPVALDNEYRVWDAFDNHYWPALYLSDVNGAIRFHHFGEGRYDETEQTIQRLLGVDRQLASVEAMGDEEPTDWDEVESSETYFGHERRIGFVPNSEGALGLNQWTLSSGWQVHSEHAALQEAPGSLSFRFHARDFHLVMGPADPGRSVRFRVLIDGEAPCMTHGLDVEEDGMGVASERRMFQLIRQPERIIDRTMRITFLEAGVELYVATFG